MPALATRVRHGTAEQGARPRRRPQGHDDSSVRPRRLTGRIQPVGPEEEKEWMQALEATSDRIDTLERLNACQLRLPTTLTNIFVV